MVQLNIFRCDAPFYNEVQKNNNTRGKMTSTDEIDQERVFHIKNSIHICGGGGDSNNNIFVTYISLVSKPNCTYDAICTGKMSTSKKKKNEENKDFQFTE